MRLLAIALLAAALGAPSAAQAGSSSGGTSAPSSSGSGSDSGGTTPRDHAPAPAKGRPVLTSFKVSATKIFELGRPAKVTFRINGRAPTVKAKLYVLRRGARVRTIDLGDQATREAHTVALSGPLPEGALELKLSARDARGRSLRAARGASAVSQIAYYRHRFPLVGAFTYGGEDARFGAGRTGHSHGGQDLPAASGTPVVAPRGGVVDKVAYQAGGAGNYIVLRGSGENRTYVFMHLLDDSTRVREGQRVRTGQRLGDVGSTGGSSGPHLHFEIWVGPWYAGGHAIDPLPDLRRWDSWS